MKRRIIPLILLLIVSGCALTIKPNPRDPGAVVNPADRSITLTRENLALSARVQNVAVGGYALERPIASFYLVATNHATEVQSLPLTTMQLRDDQGRTYSPLAPETVDQILHPAVEFMVPFPFVGYLDVTGLEAYRSSSSLASEQPYLSSGFAYEKEPDAFAADQLAGGAQVSGVIYFEIDLYQASSVDLLILPVGFTSPFEFPFLIEK